MKMEPENLSISPTPTPPPLRSLILPIDDEDEDDDVIKTLVTSLGRSLGSGPRRWVEAMIKQSDICLASSFLEGFDFGFLGVRDWLLALLAFLVVGGLERPRVRDGRDGRDL